MSWTRILAGTRPRTCTTSGQLTHSSCKKNVTSVVTGAPICDGSDTGPTDRETKPGATDTCRSLIGTVDRAPAHNLIGAAQCAVRCVQANNAPDVAYWADTSDSTTALMRCNVVRIAASRSASRLRITTSSKKRTSSGQRTASNDSVTSVPPPAGANW